MSRRANHKKVDEPSSEVQRPLTLPWPPLTPKLQLIATTLVESQICTISGVLTTAECDCFVSSLGKSDGLGGALTFETTSPVPKPGEAFRFNDRIAVYDPRFAQTLWRQTGLREACQDWLVSQHLASGRQSSSASRCWGLNPNIRLYRYQPGHKFERHFDDAVRVSTTDGRGLRESLLGGAKEDRGSEQQPALPSTLTTEYTLLIYLSGPQDPGSNKAASPERRTRMPLRGGETVFYGAGTQAIASSGSSSSLRSKRGGSKSTLATAKTKKSSAIGKESDFIEPCDEKIVASVRPIAGVALLHRHGAQCLLHEGREVISGEKYVLRSDLLFG